MQILIFLTGALALAGIAACSRPAPAASPAAVCRQLSTSDRLRPNPPSLVATAVRLFGLQAMPAGVVERGTVYRCFAGHVLVCNYGANLPCGKADTRRDLPAASAWCARNPEQDFIPMYVTGHDTIYRWRCEDGSAVTTATVFTVDPRGFISEMWKQADP